MKLHNIEFLRFIFAVGIVYFHILHSNIMKFVGDNGDYAILAKMSDNAGWIVECFFIISGYFLYESVKKEDIKRFIFKKILRLGPVLWISILLGIVFFKQSLIVSLFNSLFLQCIGLSLDYKGINWYISPFFWSIIFCFVIVKVFNKQKTNVFLCGLIYFCYLVNITYCNGGFGRETVYGVINLGMARALAGIGLGYMIAVFIEETKEIYLIKSVIHRRIVYTLVEILSLGFLIKYFFMGLRYKNNFIVVIVFSILLISFVQKFGILSNILDRTIFSILGKYSYSIYVMQQTCFYIMQKTFWKMDVVQNTIVCLCGSLVFCIFIGMIVYYLVEKPLYKKGMDFLESVR